MPTAERDHPRWIGGVAAMMAVCITHPIDQTKIRAQVQQVRQSMLGTVKHTLKMGGVKELWVGLTGSLLRQATYGSVRFGVYGELNARDAKRRKALGIDHASASTLIRNGAIAGVFAGVAGVPGELVLVRMCGDGVKPPNQRLNYRNAIQGLYRIYGERGISGMFRGAVPTTTRSVLLNASQLSCYDLIKRRLLKTGYFTDSIPLHLLTATLGGTVAITICTPADVIKSRVQVATGEMTVRQIISESLRKEGVAVLFRGWVPAWLRMTPNTALTFVFMEQIKKLV